jgi:hypothetical protein
MLMHYALRVARLMPCVIAAATVLTGCGGDNNVRPQAQIEIKTLSNRADLLSDDDALVEIVLSKDVGIDSLRVDLDGRDVRGVFARRSDGRIKGVLTGLKNGANVLTARLGSSGARLTLTNHPRGGPVFAGPQVQPWICATPMAEPASATTPATNASGLGTTATDAQCNIATEYKFFYRTTEQCSQSPRGGGAGGGSGTRCFKPYDPTSPAPADLAQTTTDRNVTVPYIVRVERGTLDRGIYDLAVLFDPAKPWDVHEPQPGWNRKLLWTFGGGSGVPHRQTAPASSWQIDYALARGFMVGASSLTDQALNSNHVVASETVLMAKEHIVDSYGELRYTIGTGCSGGSIMQLQLASLYPGLLNGLQPSCTYPDSYSTSMEVWDCVLLGNYFKTPQFVALTSGLSAQQVSAKKAVIAGHLDDKACPAWANSFGSANNPGVYVNARGQKTNNCQLLEAQVYDPAKNPDSVRCTAPEYAKSIWGLRPGTRIAPRTTDNVGIQYGLQAFAAGKLSAEEFVVLNEQIGGTDVDMNRIAQRAAADPQALDIAYEVGIISDARQWAKVPIIDLRGNDNSAIHMNWRAFAVRDRLDRGNGNHDNQVIWRFGPGLVPPQQLTVDSLTTMDKWLANIEADRSDAPQERKVVKNKPAEAFDFCYIGTDYQKKITDTTACDADPILKYYASPRQVAGGPLAENILKCQLKPLKRSDYPAGLDDEQWSRLQKVFRTGVCDWSRPGAGMQASVPWQTFASGPRGRPLPPPPISKRL